MAEKPLILQLQFLGRGNRQHGSSARAGGIDQSYLVPQINWTHALKAVKVINFTLIKYKYCIDSFVFNNVLFGNKDILYWPFISFSKNAVQLHVFFFCSSY